MCGPPQQSQFLLWPLGKCNCPPCSRGMQFAASGCCIRPVKWKPGWNNEPQATSDERREVFFSAILKTPLLDGNIFLFMNFQTHDRKILYNLLRIHCSSTFTKTVLKFWAESKDCNSLLNNTDQMSDHEGKEHPLKAVSPRGESSPH